MARRRKKNRQVTMQFNQKEWQAIAKRLEAVGARDVYAFVRDCVLGAIKTPVPNKSSLEDAPRDTRGLADFLKMQEDFLSQLPAVQGNPEFERKRNEEAAPQANVRYDRVGFWIRLFPLVLLIPLSFHAMVGAVSIQRFSGELVGLSLGVFGLILCGWIGFSHRYVTRSIFVSKFSLAGICGAALVVHCCFMTIMVTFDRPVSMLETREANLSLLGIGPLRTIVPAGVPIAVSSSSGLALCPSDQSQGVPVEVVIGQHNLSGWIALSEFKKIASNYC